MERAFGCTFGENATQRRENVACDQLKNVGKRFLGRRSSWQEKFQKPKVYKEKKLSIGKLPAMQLEPRKETVRGGHVNVTPRTVELHSERGWTWISSKTGTVITTWNALGGQI